ncbi:Glycosyltransferase involved in cell wall bisynthesis [Luteibacter sp. UNC138MFCol5.1]|nr:Glycosyltransferase involved in cell wall bisynthesis [Luteibacter sp. UNC138MFCol5.1]
MKIQIDLQGVQTASRQRGIGRYTREATIAFLKLAEGRHDVELLFNAALDGVDEMLDRMVAESLRPRRRAYGPLRDTSSDTPANDARREAGERLLTHALDIGGADVVWLSSLIEGYASDALMPHRSPRQLTAATLYDLLPLQDPKGLGQSRARDWYSRRLEALRSCDLLLAISEWVRVDAIARLGLDPDRVVAIGAGVDERFRPAAAGSDNRAYLARHLLIERPFILYNGGTDTRKNVERLFPAYAALPDHLRDRVDLVVVGALDNATRERFDKAIRAASIAPHRIHLTGYVTDEDLVRLYQACELFVFPSAGEGFGLPPLEAMACGAPVIVNDATSLPEVVGSPAALFDANDVDAMAGAMSRVLDDPSFATALRDAGLLRAARFTWPKVAERALTAIERALTTRPESRSPVATAWVATSASIQAPPDDAQIPVYLADAAHASDVLHRLREWPGLVEWQGPFPDGDHLTAFDRYRAGGWKAVATPGGIDWPEALRAEAIAMRTVESHADGEASRAAWVEAFNGDSMVRQRGIEDEIAAHVAPRLSDTDLARVADAIDRSRPQRATRWLVDVTHISRHDLRTGIQRVVRNILGAWLRTPPVGVRIEPIAFRDGRYEHAHAYAAELLGVEVPEGLVEDPVSISGDEVFVGLDWAMESLPSSATLLRTWHRAGVGMHFVANDILPITLPDAFHPQAREAFVRWLERMTDLADAVHCISQSTADDIAQWLRAERRARPPALTVFPLGVEPLRESRPGLLEKDVAGAFAARPTLLMVGTIEPRKGHAQALDALDLLWASGADLNLAIVGKRGWLVTDLIRRIERHPELGKRLFWFEGCSDETLDAVYEASTALLAPSLGEGYGLPLIEAAQRGKPVIARSLKVFREVAGDYPAYFEGTTGTALATFLARWIVDRPAPGNRLTWPAWQAAAEALADRICDSEHPGRTEKHAAWYGAPHDSA